MLNLFRSSDGADKQAAVAQARQQNPDPAQWAVGDLVMLSCHAMIGEVEPHFDAGRIGRIIQLGGRRGHDSVLVQFREGEREEINKFGMMPRRSFHPVPPAYVERYEAKAGVGFRLNKSGYQTFRKMNWLFSAATVGQQ